MNKSLLLLAISVVCIGGCKKADPLVGAWTTNVGGANATQTFNADKTFTLEEEMQGMKVKERGTWSSTEKEMTLTGSSVDVSGGNPQMGQMIKSGMEQGMKNPVAMAYSLTSPDELDVTSAQGAHQILKRKSQG